MKSPCHCIMKHRARPARTLERTYGLHVLWGSTRKQIYYYSHWTLLWQMWLRTVFKKRMSNNIVTKCYTFNLFWSSLSTAISKFYQNVANGLQLYFSFVANTGESYCTWYDKTRYVNAVSNEWFSKAHLFSLVHQSCLSVTLLSLDLDLLQKYTTR